MKRTFIITSLIMFSVLAFSQTNIAIALNDVVKTINKISIGQKADYDERSIYKSIRKMPGMAELDNMMQEYEKNGKWLKDGIEIPEKLKPNIKINGDSLIYYSNIDVDLQTMNFTLNLRSYIIKVADKHPLDVSFYLNYSAYDSEGIHLVSFNMEE